MSFEDIFLTKRLHNAVNERNLSVVQSLIREGVNVNIIDKEAVGATALHCAVRNEDVEIAEVLLRIGRADSSKVNIHNHTPLHVAINNQSEIMTELLLRYGANLEVKRNGKTYLHLVVENGNCDLAELLLKYEIDVDETSADGRTALHIAIEKKNTKMAKLLLQYNARTDVKRFGKYALYHAVMNNSLEIVKLILAANRNNASDAEEQVVALTAAFQNKNKAIVHALLEFGVNPNSTIQHTYPLHIACENEWVDTVTLLLSKGANVSKLTSFDNLSALDVALEVDNTSITNLLLQQPGINVNYKMKPSDMTPLHVAVQNNNLAITCLLLAKGAEVNVKSNVGVTPIHIAFDYDNLDLINVLIDYGADLSIPKSGLSMLEIIIENRWVYVARKVLKAGANPNEITNNGSETLLMHAISSKYFEMVRLLLHYGANVRTCNSEDGRSPLHYAVECDDEDITRLCIQYGVDLEHKNFDNESALYVALTRGRESMAKLLLDAGADYRVILRERTVLHYAVENDWLEVVHTLLKHDDIDINSNHDHGPVLYSAIVNRSLDVLRMLLDRGADVNIQYQGKTMLMHAIRNSHYQVVKMLLDRGARIEDLSDVGKNSIAGLNALFIAIYERNEMIVSLLLERNASLSVREPLLDRTPLIEAIRVGLFTSVKKMIDRCADIEAKDKTGRTGLHVAAMSGQHRVIELLMLRGAMINNPDEYKYTPLRCAMNARDYEGTELLLRLGALVNMRIDGTTTPLVKAINMYTQHPNFLNIILTHLCYSDEPVNIQSDITNCVPKNFTVLKPIIAFLVRKGQDIPEELIARDPRVQDHVLTCEMEIERMKTNTVDGRVTFYSLLTGDLKQITMFASNDLFINNFYRSNYARMYPNYKRMLRTIAEWGSIKAKMTEDATNMVILLLNPNIHKRVIDKIINYMPLLDLLNLALMYEGPLGIFRCP